MNNDSFSLENEKKCLCVYICVSNTMTSDQNGKVSRQKQKNKIETKPLNIISFFYLTYNLVLLTRLICKRTLRKKHNQLKISHRTMKCNEVKL